MPSRKLLFRYRPWRANLRYLSPVWNLGVFHRHHRYREWQRIHGSVEPKHCVFLEAFVFLLFLLDAQRTNNWDVGLAIAVGD